MTSQLPLDQLAPMVPLKDYPRYLIEPSGHVYYRTDSGDLRPLKVRQTSRGRLYVHVHDDDGRRHCLGIKKLLIDAFLEDEQP